MTMAQKRLIDKKISLSEKVADLELLGQLLYERMIIHADDFGLLQSSPRTVKAQAIPMIDTTSDEVARNLTKMIELGLIEQLEINKQSYLRIVGHEREQRLRRDMNPLTIISVKLSSNYEKNWQTIDDLISRSNQIRTKSHEVVTASDEIATEVKLSEVNIIPKGIGAKAPEKQQAKPFGSAHVNHVLACFEKLYGFPPTDSKPRNVAHNLVQKMKTALKAKNPTVTDELLTQAISTYFYWISEHDWHENIQRLETIKNKLPMFVAERKKYAA